MCKGSSLLRVCLRFVEFVKRTNCILTFLHVFIFSFLVLLANCGGQVSTGLSVFKMFHTLPFHIMSIIFADLSLWKMKMLCALFSHASQVTSWRQTPQKQLRYFWGWLVKVPILQKQISRKYLFGHPVVLFLLHMLEITLFNICAGLRADLVSSQGSIRRRLNRNFCLRLSPLVAVETRAVMESRRVREGWETALRGEGGGGGWIRSLNAPSSQPTQLNLKAR